uniref:Chemokine interleukin-8-like domain-containing protein n=1 Tax=Sinocyclocheilus rhinocerous TaxID=307959 RepID=A0A673KP44_9TELE
MMGLCLNCPVRCCTKYSSQPFPVLRLKDFTWQDATMTCNIEAVIFTSVKNRQICANPDDLWFSITCTYIYVLKQCSYTLNGSEQKT